PTISSHLSRRYWRFSLTSPPIFFSPASSPTQLYTLSLHDALPILDSHLHQTLLLPHPYAASLTFLLLLVCVLLSQVPRLYHSVCYESLLTLFQETCEKILEHC